MSEWGSIATALDAALRAADATFPAGTKGIEQGIRPPASLGPDEWPHAFIHDPTEQTNELDWQQREVRFAVQVSIFSKGETQEQVNTRLDALATRIDADPTLGGLVAFAFCSTRSTLEAQFVGSNLRAGVAIVQTRKVTR